MGQGRLKQGILQHRGTFAFLLVEEPGERDVFVRGPSLRLAMDGDLVEVRCRAGRGRPEGEIVRVLRRGRTTFVGVLRSSGGKWWLEPSGDEAPWAEVTGFESVRPQAGRLAAARITRWPTRSVGVGCVVTELLGRPGDPGVRTKAVILGQEIPERFPDKVLAQARNFPRSVSEQMSRGRRDLRESTIFTIDGADAKDFDDAVSIERVGGNLRLGVHIADVSHYVEVGSELDREALRRGTSVYLPGRVIPMLPPNLSDNLCSLMPDVDRLAFSCFMDIDGGGRVVRREFAESVIRSCRRFTYEEVEDLIKDRRVHRVSREALEAVRVMGRLAKQLTSRRMARGALDIDLPEYKVEVEPSGAPKAVVRQERLDSHRLIEEFMILANEAVAGFLRERGRVFPYRIHEDPDPEKLAALQEDFRKLGISAPGNLASAGVKGLQGLLKKIKGHPLHDILGVMVMRSLKQAVYSARSAGHFGLASEAYCHFTSPIRRYPDLVTHRVLRECLAEKPAERKRPGRGRGRKGRRRGQEADMAKICAHASVRERAAAEAERKVVGILRAELMARRIGKEFEGTVVRAAPFGVFVELTGVGITGLVRGAKTIIGTQVRVLVRAVDENKGEISLDLIGASARAPKPGPPKRALRKRRGRK